MNDGLQVEPITLMNAGLRLQLDPMSGARVTSLYDVRRDREWIKPGATLIDSDAAPQARYGAMQASGWDECFPTVSPCPVCNDELPQPGVQGAQGAQGTHDYRDHGELWGRPWWLLNLGVDRCTLAYEDATGSYRFKRQIVLEDDGVAVHYEVRNHSDKPYAFLWAMHLLLDLQAGEHIALPHGTPMRCTWRSDSAALGVYPWPSSVGSVASSAHEVVTTATPGATQVACDTLSLDEVMPRHAGFAAKLHTEARPPQGVRVGNAKATLQIQSMPAIAVSDDVAQAVSLWLCYGGWPRPQASQEDADALAPTEVHQVGVELASAGYDTLQAAKAAGREVLLAPGQSRRWSVRLRLQDGFAAGAMP